MTKSTYFNADRSSFEGVPYLIAIEMEDHLRTRMVRAMHEHDDRIEILLVRNGKGIHTIDDRAYHTGPGDILIYNAGVMHDECADSERGMDILSCSIGGVKFQDMPAHTLIPPHICPIIQDGVCSAEVEALMSLLLTAKIDPRRVNPEMVHHLLCVLLLLVRNAATQDVAQPSTNYIDLVRGIQSYIDNHYQEEITLADISDALNLSQYYLSRIFKRALGYSPMQYIIRRRIGEAQSWLLMSDKSVTDIAYHVGYNSASNFNNAFRNMVGVTPQRYRELWRNEKNKHGDHLQFP